VLVEDMYRTFNMGIGLIVVVEADNAEALTRALAATGGEPIGIGEIVAGDVPAVTYSSSPASRA
jgi:phosphoribosylaminoimidazole (AIR) synthetase